VPVEQLVENELLEDKFLFYIYTQIAWVAPQVIFPIVGKFVPQDSKNVAKGHILLRRK
jgi:hypothetical protein